MQKAALVQETELRELPKRDPGGGGLGTTAQILPFHLSTSGSELAGPFVYEPTAMQNVVLAHDTLSSVSPLFPGLRLATTDQERPFHRSTSVLWSSSSALFEYAPAAMQKVALVHETPSRSFALDPGFLLAEMAQELPPCGARVEVLGSGRYVEVEAVVVLGRLVEASEVATGPNKTAKATIGSVRTRSTRRDLRIFMQRPTSRS